MAEVKKAHNWSRHGGYTILSRVSSGRLDGRGRVALSLKARCNAMVRDLGEERWENLPIAKQLLVERAVVKALILARMDIYALTHGIINESGHLIPPLGEDYLAFSNSLRSDLVALGLERKEKIVMDLAAALAEIPEGEREKD